MPFIIIITKQNSDYVNIYMQKKYINIHIANLQNNEFFE